MKPEILYRVEIKKKILQQDMNNKVLVILPINKLAYTVNVWWMSFYQNNRDIKQPYIKYKYFNIRAGWYIEIKLEGKL